LGPTGPCVGEIHAFEVRMVLPRTGLIAGLRAIWRQVSQLGQDRRGLYHGRIGRGALQLRRRLNGGAAATQHHGCQRDHGHDIPPAIAKKTTVAARRDGGLIG